MVDTDIKSPIFPVRQVNLLQLFATITGEARIVLFAPQIEKHLTPFTNNVSSIDIKHEIEKDNTELEFIEVVLREGNLIYIPYGWFYFIYGNNIDLDTIEDEQHRETIVLDCINKSIIDL